MKKYMTSSTTTVTVHRTNRRAVPYSIMVIRAPLTRTTFIYRVKVARYTPKSNVRLLEMETTGLTCTKE
jgi:hypothetical protein